MNSTALLFALRPPPPPSCLPHPPSPGSPTPLSENSHWESILPHKSNHIILSFSISTLSLPPSTSSLTLSFSYLSSFSFHCLTLSLPRKGHPMWWKMQVKGWGIFPFQRCNPIRSAGDVGLKRHRRARLLLSPHFNISYLCGAVCQSCARAKTHLITAAFGSVEHSPFYPSGVAFQCHQSVKVSPVCSAHGDLPFATCHVHHQM